MTIMKIALIKNYRYSLIVIYQFFLVLYMIPLLSPGPKTWADSLGQQHDNEVPGSQAENLQSCSTNLKQFQATGNYFASAAKGVISGEAFKVPINGIIGGIGLGFINLVIIDGVQRAYATQVACLRNPRG